MMRLKLIYRTADELQWFLTLLGGSVLTVSRTYPSGNDLDRVHIDVKMPGTNGAKPC